METVIEKILGLFKKYSIGSFLAILGVVLIIMVYNNQFELPFWVVIGAFGLLSIVLIIQIAINKKKGNIIDDENEDNQYKHLLDKLIVDNIDGQKALELLEKGENITKILDESGFDIIKVGKIIELLRKRPSLLQHDLFTVSKIQFIEKLEAVKRKMPSDTPLIRRSIPDYIILVTTDLIEAHREYVEKNIDEIMDETKAFNFQVYLQDFLIQRNKTKESAILKGFSIKLIDKFSEVVLPAIDKFKNTVLRVKASSLAYNDYIKFYVILDAVVSLLEWINNDYLDVFLNMNGELIGGKDD